MSSKLIKWRQVKKQTHDLKPHPYNPRTIKGAEYERLKKSIKEIGYNQRILVNRDDVVLSGNQRLIALKELEIDEIEVLVPSRDLTKAEEERILIQSNINNGEFDYEILGNVFDLDQLSDWGLPLSFDLEEKIEEEEEKEKKEKKPKECPNCGELL